MAGYTSYSITDILNIAKINIVLVTKNKAKNYVYKGGYSSDYYSRLIYAKVFYLDWLNTNSPSDTTIPSIANYVLGLCPYISDALNLLNLGGMIIDPYTGKPSSLSAYSYQVTVGAATSPATGATTYTIPYAKVMPNSVTIHLDGSGQLPYGTDTGRLMYTVAYGAASSVVTFSQALTANMTLMFNGIIYSSSAGSASSSAGYAIPTLVEGEFLTNDGTNLAWENPEFTITQADFATATTYINTLFSHHTIDVRYETGGGVLLTNGADYSVSGNTLTILLPGFDALTGTYKFTIYLKNA